MLDVVCIAHQSIT